MTRLISHRQAEWLRTVLFVLVLCAGARAQEFAGGTGTPEDPYQIATPGQFQQMGTWSWKTPNAHFVLVADIDCSGMNEGPFSKPSDTFDAVLDGNSYTVRNLAIAPGATAQAIFPMVGSRGIVRHLVVEDCRTYAQSGSAVGVLCGTNEGQLLHCHVNDCVVSMERECDVGILAGVNLGLVEDCRAHGVTVVSFHPSSSEGGLVGRNLGVMRYCAAEGSVFGSGHMGGLAGTNGGAMEACWTRAVVTAATGGQVSGGLVGINQGRIADCYTAGLVWGGQWQGGLVGQQPAGEIVNCYSTSPVFPFWSPRESGPLVGQGDAMSVHSCYYLSEDGATYAPDTLGTGLSFTEMVRRENYADWAFSDEDPHHPWLMTGTSLPRLAWEFEQDIPVVAGRDVNEAQQVLGQRGWQIGEVRSDYSRQIPAGQVIWTFPSRRAMPGTPIDIVVSQGPFDWSAVSADPDAGTAACPLKIRTAGQLEALRDLPQVEDKHIELAADIDMAGRVFSEALLGTMSTVLRHATGKDFTGSLQGNGFEISNLTIRAFPPAAYPALVGSLSESGRITNLRLRRATLTALTSHAGQTGGALVGLSKGVIQACHVQDSFSAGVRGGLVGENYGTVAQCSSVHSLIHSPGAGGLVASNRGTVDQCCSDVWVGSGGGLVDQNAGRLTNSYARGTVLGPGGTLAGYNSGDISFCYATGAVARNDGSVSLDTVGTNGGRITDCHYRLYQPPWAYGRFSGTAGTPLRDAQMRHRSSFRNWDFWGVQTDGLEDVWFMPADGCPILTWQYAHGDLPAVPPVLDLYVDDALSRLRSAGITATARDEFDDRVPVARVFRTEAGSTRDDETAVTVVASLGPCDWAHNGGDGSAANPYTIARVSELFSLAEHPELWDRCFVLTADLDLGWTPLDRALIAADVNAVQRGFQGPCFNGTFDGTGHTLAHLAIASAGSYLGLFGALGPNACITHLHVEHACIAGAEYVGPIAGVNEGILDDCHTSGWITGSQYVGALVGYATGTLKGCSSTIAEAPYAGRAKRSIP